MRDCDCGGKFFCKYRTGTLWCLLFGHKFMGKTNIMTDEWNTTWNWIRLDYCIRCGRKRE